MGFFCPFVMLSDTVIFNLGVCSQEETNNVEKHAAEAKTPNCLQQGSVFSTS